MKKMFFWCTIFLGGLIGSLAIFITSIFHPWSYNSIDGFKGFLLCSESLFAFRSFIIMSVLSLFIMYKESYIKNY